MAAEQLTISFKAMQRSRTTIEDFVQSYFPYVGLDPAKDLFRFLDVLVWVEATIYQLDEDNEALARQGDVAAGMKLLGESVVSKVLRDLGLLSEAVQQELEQGDFYWEGERKLCAAMLHHKLDDPASSAASPQLSEQEASCPRPSKQQRTTVEASTTQPPFPLDEVLRVHEAKSFDYRLLHLILRGLVKAAPDKLLLEFLRVDELLVDIGDDLTDYEDDVERNSFNILRCYVHMYGREAPMKLVERISALEQQHASLLGQLPDPLRQHYWSRHQQAVEEGGGAGSGRWVFPPLILDEDKFRQDLLEESP